MKAEVINTGTEILLGNVFNSHLGFLAQALFPLGIRIQRQTTVPDGMAIRDALTESFSRTDLLFVTGGLGPTTDDVTREITSELLGLELKEDHEVLNLIEARFARRGLTLTDRIKRQAQVPCGATVLRNRYGTAPGLYFLPMQTRGSPHLFLLPGPPRELEPMFTDSVMPILTNILPPNSIDCRTFRIAGLGESTVEEKVGAELLLINGLELGYCARPGEVEVRCIGNSTALKHAEAVLEKIKPYIISQDNRSLEEVVVKHLTARAEKLAVAESCTGGFLANRITNVPGASQIFVEGFVTYSNEAKIRSLDIEPGLLTTQGAVSRQVVTAMAEKAIRISGADYALATTGIAGPDGGSPEKPVGTIYVSLASKDDNTEVEIHQFPTDRETFKWLASQAALDLLRRHLARHPTAS